MEAANSNDDGLNTGNECAPSASGSSFPAPLSDESSDFPGRPSCILSRRVGENSDHGEEQLSGLSGAALVSNPVCMTAAGVSIGKPWTMGWIYNLVITHRCASWPMTKR